MYDNYRFNLLWLIWFIGVNIHTLGTRSIYFRVCKHFSRKRVKPKIIVESKIYKLLANSTCGTFVETVLKRMKVKFATTWNDREDIIQKHEYDIIAGPTMYSGT